MRVRLALLLAAAVPIVPIFAAAPVETPTQLPRDIRPLRYALDIVPDAKALRFTGKAAIDLEVLRPTESVTLNALELDIASVRIARQRAAPVTGTVSVDAASQTASFRFPERLAPGRYTLFVDYAGRINRQASGFFALDYQDKNGAQRGLFTQFAPVDGRRFVPSWDEPQFRTPYDISVSVPTGQTAVSNMPALRTEPQPDGTARVTFQTTPAMSSYLLFLGVGPFERVTTRAGATEVGIVTKAGGGDQARFALAETARVLPWFTNYFGQPYPLPKLDNVAGPGSSQSFAAMENWGAIFTFDRYLLVDPKITTEAARQGAFTVLAHETAHQWFGNLVTMAWWDDIWLNESFASWVTTKAAAALHPEWEPELGLVATRERAMALDSVASTHAVIRPVKTVDEMNSLFDVITYQKGEAVLTMLEDYVGEAPWRQGVRAYVAANLYGNTTTAELWRRIEAASRVPVSRIADDFTRQPGIPLIRVESARCENGRTSLQLSQREFSRDRVGKPPLAWRVPVIAGVSGQAETRALVTGGGARLQLAGCGTAIVNRGQTGYYRTLYAPAVRAEIERGYPALPAIDQIGLLADAWALGLAGYQPASAALALIDRVPADANPQLWGRAAGILADLHRLYAGDGAQQALVARYGSARLAPVLARIGRDPRAGERDTDAVLRATLIATLGAIGDPAITAEARRRFAADHPSVTAGPLRAAWLGVVAAGADAATWERLAALARAERSPQVRLQLYELLGEARDPALAGRALALALTDEPGATNAAAIIAAVGQAHPELAFRFAAERRAQVEALLDVVGRAPFIPALAAASADPATVAELGAYAARQLTPNTRGPVDIAIASVQDRVKVRQDRLPDITRWLQERSGGAGATEATR